MARINERHGGPRPNSGRKSKAEEVGLAALLEKCFTTEDREACLLKLAGDCQSSDFQIRHESRKLLFAYTFGKPTEKHEHSGEGGGAIEIIVRHVKRSPKDSD